MWKRIAAAAVAAAIFLTGCERLQLKKAASLYSKHRYTDSLAILENLSNSSSEKIRAQALLYEGFCYMQLGDYEQALAAFGKVANELQNSKLHDDALFWMGRCYQAAGNVDKAIEYYKKVVNYPEKRDKAYTNMKAQALNYIHYLTSHNDSRQ